MQVEAYFEDEDGGGGPDRCLLGYSEHKSPTTLRVSTGYGANIWARSKERIGRFRKWNKKKIHILCDLML